MTQRQIDYATDLKAKATSWIDDNAMTSGHIDAKKWVAIRLAIIDCTDYIGMLDNRIGLTPMGLGYLSFFLEGTHPTGTTLVSWLGCVKLNLPRG